MIFLRSLKLVALALTGAVTLALGCGAARVDPSSPRPRGGDFGDLTTLAGSKTDKGAPGHHFTEIYEHILFPLRNDELRILEIGIAEGGSLVLWYEYFPNAQIYAIDIVDKSGLENERVTTLVADQASRDQLGNFIEAHGGGFDFILDDGGHTMEQQQVSLGYLFPYVKPGGYYIVEDVHTSLIDYWPGYGAATGGRNTTLTMIDEFVRTSTIKSEYMTEEEQRYLTENIEYSNLFFRNNEQHSITCIFKKRVP